MLDEFPRLKDWDLRMKARPSWAETVDKWGDTSSPVRQEHGKKTFPRIKAMCV